MYERTIQGYNQQERKTYRKGEYKKSYQFIFDNILYFKQLQVVSKLVYFYNILYFKQLFSQLIEVCYVCHVNL